MKKPSTSFCIVIMLTAVCTANAQWKDSTQQRREPACTGRVYEDIEIPNGQGAKITSKPAPNLTQEDLKHDVRGLVILEGTFCRTGKVSDLRVIQGLPFGRTERALEAALSIRFTPAEMNWHTVSQKRRFQYSFNEPGLDALRVSNPTGLLVEAIDLVGYRRLKASDIISHIQTRPGGLYNEQQIQRDLASILSMGFFNRNGTGVTIEAGVRGGVVIVFEVKELPVR